MPRKIPMVRGGYNIAGQIGQEPKRNHSSHDTQMAGRNDGKRF